MEYTALWGPKGFIISPSKIVPLMNLSTSFSVKTDSGNDAGGTATTNTRGRELQSVSLSTLYVRGAGVDPRGQIAEWEAQVGKAYPLYIQGQRFGPSKLMLKSVDVSDILLTNTGKFLQCAVSLNFEEYTTETAKAKTTVAAATTTTSTQAASTYNRIVAEKQAALNATAKPLDKAAKKPTAKGMVAK
jgi:hypothetical protein